MKNSVYSDMEESEKQVAKCLRELDLWWQYEFPVFVYDEKKRPRVWTPDFYIPKLGMYIEVCGSEEFDYRYRENLREKRISCYLRPSLRETKEMEKLLD